MDKKDITTTSLILFVVFLVLGIVSLIFGCNEKVCLSQTILNSTVIDSRYINTTCVRIGVEGGKSIEDCSHWESDVTTFNLNCTIWNGPYEKGTSVIIFYDKSKDKCVRRTMILEGLPYFGITMLILSIISLFVAFYYNVCK